jgi:DTW domain-containing protein YfiP
MRSNKPRDEYSHCPRCYQRREICICPILPTVTTRTEILILRHIWEAERPSNTGRLAALAMPNSRIIPCGGGARAGISPIDDEFLRVPGTWLLWPDGTGTQSNVSELKPPARVVVIDATCGARHGDCIAVCLFCRRCPGWFCRHQFDAETGCGSNIVQTGCQRLRR